MKCRGIALLMGLVLLAAISLLALMAANGMLLQRRMSANFGAGGRALAQATRGTEAARAWLNSRADFERESGCIERCILPFAIHDSGQLPRNPEFESSGWWQIHGVAAGLHPETGEPLTPGDTETGPPWWIIEELRYESAPATPEGVLAGIGYYRVLARGSGGSLGGLGVTESIIARPWGDGVEPGLFPSDGQAGAFCRQFDPAIPCGTLAWRQRR
jgi:Tfp pilus assembly protein PilX